MTEYEAECFVALSRLGEGTARDVSANSSVPRSRVYEIAEQLAQRGLVETKQASPRRFRTISLDAAISVLQEQFMETTEQLRESLEQLDPISEREDTDSELWTLADRVAIEQRVVELINDADDEIMYYVSQPEACSEEVITALQSAHERDVRVIIGTTAATTFERLDGIVPEQLLLKLDQEWFDDQSLADEEESAIVRMLVVDRRAILVSTGDETGNEDQAVFGQGLNNGLVVVVRRLMASSLADVTTVN